MISQITNVRVLLPTLIKWVFECIATYEIPTQVLFLPHPFLLISMVSVPNSKSPALFEVPKDDTQISMVILANLGFFAYLDREISRIIIVLTFTASFSASNKALLLIQFLTYFSQIYSSKIITLHFILVAAHLVGLLDKIWRNIPCSKTLLKPNKYKSIKCNYLIIMRINLLL